MTKTALAALLVLAASGAARAQAPAAAPAPVMSAPARPEVKASSASFVAASPATIYTTEKIRNPFSPASAGIIGGKAYDMADFSIHNLTLKGLMKDRAADFALFTDNTYGASFILRRGKLSDPKGKAVPGVKGSMDLKKKTAYLETSDGDVQLFGLGDEGID